MTKTQQEEQGRSCFRTTIGGQALIEGILMRGPSKQAIVVRGPEGGLIVKEEKLKLVRGRSPLLSIPVVRGVMTFGASLYNGIKALMFSAEFYPEDGEEEEEPGKVEQWLEARLGSEKLTSLITALALVLGVGFSIVLFFLLPTFVAGLFDYFWNSALIHNVVEAVIRIVVFLGYLILCSRMKDIKRVFSYHGAEHKSIFCYERGLELTVENVRKMPRHHPRCGTSFLFVVIIISILVSSVVFSLPFVAWDNLWVRMGLHLLLLPLVVGISYEINRYAGRHDNPVTRVLTAPGLWLQNFTTFEPDASMIEVGIEALKLVLPEEKGADAW